jgi:ferredoxin
MIITKKKDRKNVFKAVKNYNSFFLIGCSECASLCGTGNEEALKELADFLKQEGKKVTGIVVPKTGCKTLGTKIELKKNNEACKAADAIIVLSCGAGTQSVVEIFPDKPVYPANDSFFLGNMTRFQMFDERCSLCGECIIDLTGGLCPITLCPKGILVGPCGGCKDGNCEVSPDIKCAWIRIYERMKKLDQLDQFRDTTLDAKDWSKSVKPRTLISKEENRK